MSVGWCTGGGRSERWPSNACPRSPIVSNTECSIGVANTTIVIADCTDTLFALVLGKSGAPQVGHPRLMGLLESRPETGFPRPAQHEGCGAARIVGRDRRQPAEVHVAPTSRTEAAMTYVVSGRSKPFMPQAYDRIWMRSKLCRPPSCYTSPPRNRISGRFINSNTKRSRQNLSGFPRETQSEKQPSDSLFFSVRRV